MRFSVLFIAILLLLFPSFAQAETTSETSQQVTEIIIKKVEKKLKYNQKNIISFLSQIPALLDNIIIKRDLSDERAVLLQDVSKNIYELLNQKEFAATKQQEQKFFSNIPAYSSFLNVAENEDFIFLENGVWYYYDFTAGRHYPSKENITLENLKFSNIDPTTSILLYHRSSGKVMIVEDTFYTKKKIVSNSIIYGVSDKYSFLKRIKKDLYFQANSNVDEILLSIQKKADILKKGKTKQETILAFYTFVLENMDYSSDISKNDVYSGLVGFVSGDGVCEAYITSMEYLLWLSGFHDVEFMPGNVIDSSDFPNIGHAWLRIDDSYYDPTFDDPVGAVTNREPKDYRYFGLPRDLFYTNRYDLGDTPKSLKKEDLSYRKKLVKQKIGEQIKKYPVGKYPLLREFEFRKKYTFNQFESFTVNKLKLIFPEYKQVDNFLITNTNKKQRITHINYFTLTGTENIEAFLEQIYYDTKDYNLFIWKTESGTIEYRVSSDYKF